MPVRSINGDHAALAIRQTMAVREKYGPFLALTWSSKPFATATLRITHPALRVKEGYGQSRDYPTLHRV